MPRLQAIATPLVQDMEKVQIIPPPKEVEPTVLAWKGAAVLGKMDGVSELWVTAADWVCFFLMRRNRYSLVTERTGTTWSKRTMLFPLMCILVV